ncbi:MAG: hypothetical protein AAF391_11100 [Bacteroidota bacterium]
MKKHLLPLCLFLIPFVLVGQSKEELEIIQYHQKIYNGLLDDHPVPNYLFPIVREDSLINTCKGSQFESLAYQSLSWYNSYIGEYHRSLELFSNTLEPQGLQTDEFIDLSKYKAFSAKEEIVSKAKDYDFILINESHHKPQHRLFVHTILQSLYENGFQVLAVEGIGIEDTIFNTTKIPTKELGGLTMEPYFADLIRHALDIGYELLPYDYDTEFDFVKRDSLGAKRIVEYQQKHRQKVLVFCGYEHVDKTQRSLAYWVEAYSGKSALSVNQSRHSEEYEKKFESLYYQMATELFVQDAPFVLKKKKEDFKDESADLFVFHPRAYYDNKIASWQMNYDQQRLLVTFPQEQIPEIEELSLLQIFRKNEYNLGIPVFQLMYDSQEETRIVISPGAYTLKIENVEREELFKVNFQYGPQSGITITD